MMGTRLLFQVWLVWMVRTKKERGREGICVENT